MLKSVIILGGGSSLKYCVYNPEAEVWCCASAIFQVEWREVDKAFAFDRSSKLKDEIPFCKDHHITIVSSYKYADEIYPTTAIKRAFSICYTHTTVSYMLALAIYQGYRKITLYGVDQSPEERYLYGKPYVTFWVGVAVGRDICIETPGSPLLLEPVWCPYESEDIKMLKAITPDKKLNFHIPAGGNDERITTNAIG